MGKVANGNSSSMQDMRAMMKELLDQRDKESQGSKGFSSVLPLDKERMGQLNGVKSIYAAKEAGASKKLDKAKERSSELISTNRAIRQLDDYTKDLITSSKAVGIYDDAINAGKSVFSSRTAEITISSGTNCISVDVENGADLASHTVSVSRLAYAGSRSILSAAGVGFSSSIADVTNAGAGGVGYFALGTFNIQSLSAAGASADITIVAGDTLGTIRDKINSVTTTTKVSAIVVNTGTGYTLSCVSKDTGLANDFNITDGGALAGLQVEGLSAPFAQARHMEIAATGASGFVDKVSDITTAGGGNIVLGGTFILNGASITVGATASLNDMVTLINNSTATTGVVASITVNTGGGFNLALDLSGTIASKILLTDATPVFGGTITKTSTTASDSLAIVDGASIANSSNSILPLSGQPYVDTTGITRYPSPKITFNLKAVNSSNAVQNVNIIPDSKEIMRAIDKFMDSWNKLSKFVAKQTARDLDADGNATRGYESSALLGKLSANILSIGSVRQALNAIVNNVSGTTQAGISNLSDVGIVITKVPPNSETGDPAYDVLAADTKKFEAAMSKNFIAVQALFVPTLDPNGQNVGYYGLSSYKTKFSNFDLSFNLAGGSAAAGVITDRLSGATTAVTVNYDATIDSVSVTGDAGTDAEGILLSCGNVGGGAAGPKTYTNLSLSHGVVNILSSFFGDYITTGPLQNRSVYALAQLNVENKSTDSQKRVTNLQKKYDAMLAKHQRRLNALARQLNTVQNKMKEMEKALG